KSGGGGGWGKRGIKKGGGWGGGPRGPERPGALRERCGPQAKFILLQVTQPAVDQLAAGRAGVHAEIVLFHEEDGESPPGGVACDAHAVDAAADDQQIVALFHLKKG